MGSHIYISPHLDDAALSCGASIHRQVRAGEGVLVVTVCTAGPAGAELSRLAARLHAQMGAPADVVATRVAEDGAAMAVLGASALHLAVADAIYRRDGGEGGAWLYGTRAALFGEVHAGDAGLAADIADAVAARAGAGALIHAPLGVGGHVDHRLGSRAGWLLVEAGHAVCFYEDFPYSEPVAGASPVDAVVRAQPRLVRPELAPCSADDVDARVRAVQAYASQLALVFGDPATVAPRVRAAVKGHGPGPGAPAERRWRPA